MLECRFGTQVDDDVEGLAAGERRRRDHNRPVVALGVQGECSEMPFHRGDRGVKNRRRSLAGSGIARRRDEERIERVPDSFGDRQ